MWPGDAVEAFPPQIALGSLLVQNVPRSPRREPIHSQGCSVHLKFGTVFVSLLLPQKLELRIRFACIPLNVMVKETTNVVMFVK